MSPGRVIRGHRGLVTAKKLCDVDYLYKEVEAICFCLEQGLLVSLKWR